MKLSDKSLNTFLFAIVASFTIFLAIYHVGIEHNIYFWDSNGYWRFWQQFGSNLFVEPANAFLKLASSIKNDDYNLLPVAITSVFYMIGGEDRLAYILSLSIMYLLPVTILFSMLLIHFSEKRTFYWKVITLIFPAKLVAFWAHTLRGYPNIAGLIFIIFSVIYSIKIDLSVKLDIQKAIVLGALLWAPFLLRRWYAYTIVSLYISLPLLNYYLYKNNENSFKKLINIAIFFFASIISTVLLDAFMQLNLLLRIANPDYSFIYSAYQSSIELSFYNILHDIGLYLLPLFFFSIFISIFVRKTKKDYLVMITSKN